MLTPNKKTLKNSIDRSDVPSTGNGPVKLVEVEESTWCKWVNILSAQLTYQI